MYKRQRSYKREEQKEEEAHHAAHRVTNPKRGFRLESRPIAPRTDADPTRSYAVYWRN